MTLNELIDIQRNFDGEHKGKFCWNEKVSGDNLEILEFLIIALIGEVGEMSNLVKKVIRGDFMLDEKKDELSEELADVLAYLLKLSYQLDIDLEKAYLNKMVKNKERFQKYELQGKRGSKK
jgi:NTP pyrophosphatase (non-canonical NTP hydrolase)